jgi:hypothetical protein
MRLGELLLEEKLITAEALEEALESQVVHGGRLGTNLVELGLVSEEDLARMLGKLHNVAHASGEMVPDPRALEMVDLNQADQKDYLPMRVDATRMSVAVVDPQDIATLDALAFQTGRRVVPVVIPEFRMNQAQRRYCKSFRPMRAIDMNSLRPSRTLKGAEEKAAAEPVGDLISEEEFQSLYAQALHGGEELAAAEEELLLTEVVEEVRAPVAAPRPAPVAPPPAPVQVPAPPPVRADAPPPVMAPVEPALPTLPPLGMEAPPPPPPPMAPPLTPMSFAEAQAELARSSDREEVATTVLRYAVSKWKRCLLLSVQGSLVTGWRGMGKGVREAAVRRIGIRLSGPGTFKLVHDTRSHYVGPVRRDASSGLLYKLLGGDYPTTAVILPLLVRGKLVHMLYVDNGPGQLTTPDVGELLILSQSVGRSYEAMIRRRQSA